VWGGERGFSLAVLFFLSGAPDEALVSPLPSRTSGLSEGLRVCVLLGMDLVVQEVFCQLVSVFNLQLGEQRRRQSLTLSLALTIGHE